MSSFVTVDEDRDLRREYRAASWWTDESLAELLAGALHDSRRKTFAVHSRGGERRKSLGQMASWGRRIAGGLHRRGIRAGDVVAFQLANSVEAAAIFYGLVHLGAILVPVGHALGHKELRYALKSTSARALFAQGDVAAMTGLAWAIEGLQNLEHVIVVGADPSGTGTVPFPSLADGDELHAAAVSDPAAPAVVGWTSGSTAEPKGVLLSHRALCAEVRLHMAPMMAARERPVLSTSPISHVTGMLMSLLVPPLVGHDVHLMDFWEPGAVLTLMRDKGLAAGSGAPVFLQSLLDDPRCGPQHLSLIDVAPLGGATVPPALIERADCAGVIAFKGYGCTEHPSISLGSRHDSVALRSVSDGRLCTGVQARVRDDSGRHHATGTGELLTRGPDLFSGYVDSALNAEAFEEGWYRTGDIGVIDDRGRVTVVDRLKDIIIRSGLNVSASEVEAALQTMPEVADVAVVAAPDPRTGERGCAFVRPADGYRAPTLARIGEHMSELGIAKYKWPEEVRETTEDFPRTAAGKVIKSALRTRAHHSQGTGSP